MNINDSKEIRERFKKEYDQNCTKIECLDEKINILNKNRLKKRIITTGLFSIIPWFIGIGLIPKALNVIPLYMIQPLCYVAPILVGIAGERLLTKIQKNKKKLRKFSKAKTEKEKLEESTKYEIEKAKLKNANKILKRNISNLRKNDRFVSLFQDNYNQKDDRFDNTSKEEIAHNFENMSEISKKEYQKLDIATTRKFLAEYIIEKDWSYKESFYKVLFCFTSIMSYYIPNSISESLYHISISAPTTIMENIPGIVLAILGGNFIMKDNENKKIVFNNINDKLGNNRTIIDDALDKELVAKESEQITEELKDSLKATTIMRLELEKARQKLINFSTTSNYQKDKEGYKDSQKSYTDKEFIADSIISCMEKDESIDAKENKPPVLSKNMNNPKKQS